MSELVRSALYETAYEIDETANESCKLMKDVLLRIADHMERANPNMVQFSEQGLAPPSFRGVTR